MSAVQAIKQEFGIAVLKAPYNKWSASEVLAYFHDRQHIHYFAVANEPEVEREKIDRILENDFTFNGETYHIPNLDWLSNPSSDIEWSIMLHKFYYAVGLGMAFRESGDQRYADKWMALTTRWIDSVPLNFLSSDVTGRRVQNWVYAHYYFVSNHRIDTVCPEFYGRFLTAIHQQVSHLIENLTPARNHRTLELYTVFLVAVVFPELKNADTWLQFSIAELQKNIQADILADGVHCELSTDYHHIVLRNFLAVKRLAVLNDIALPIQIDEGIKNALAFALHVHKPDGTLPSLSDGDTGSFLSLLQQGYELYGCEHMLYVATRGQRGIPPSQRSEAFPSGGYYLLRSGWGDGIDAYEDERYLVFDCGDLGAGNHGHIDLLNFEMAAYGQSLIVDPGRYTYDESGDTNWRVLFRGTGYHNTVLVDGKNQTRYEFHSQKFKIKGPAPDHELKAFICQQGLDYIHGIARSHEYPVTHERKILFVNGEYWLICDVLRADETHHYAQLFHLAATAQGQVAVNNPAQGFSIDAPNLLILQVGQQGISASIDEGFVSPGYGIKQAAPVATFSQQGSNCCFYTILYPYKSLRPNLQVSTLPVFKGNEVCSPVMAVCLNIQLERDGQLLQDQLFVANEHGAFTVDGQNTDYPAVFARTLLNPHGESRTIQHRIVPDFSENTPETSL